MSALWGLWCPIVEGWMALGLTPDEAIAGEEDSGSEYLAKPAPEDAVLYVPSGETEGANNLFWGDFESHSEQ